ncbi:DUF1955 domain-containing protein [Stygiolobus caldivivus]|uniref:Uncharacterized protein n=1 Tax=Stygiolobus caldivivus TaxID=2824673 RepID=A0A8D5ZH15_9CREN|nr:DUF1955 domain-containing protein [Stygiolobus caldivivus]BCU71443.1 hypothetical protein KN1_27400 [Stygiolobus caldivivus]
MTIVKSDLLKRLMDAKKFFLDGYIDEGVKIVQDVLKSSPQKEEYNWFICNLIESVDCKYLFPVLDRISSSFDISKCQNVKNVVMCGILQNIYNSHVDLALNVLVEQGKRDRLEDITKEVFKVNPEVNGEILYKLAEALRKVGDEKTATVLLNEACKKGVKEACSNAVVPPPRSVM